MKFLFIVCALLLSGMARAQNATQITLQNHIQKLHAPGAQSGEVTAFSLGVIYGYYIQGINSMRGDITNTILETQDALKINTMPTRDVAAYAINQYENALSDLVFCLYRGIAHGNSLAGQTQAEIAKAAISNPERFQRACVARNTTN